MSLFSFSCIIKCFRSKSFAVVGVRRHGRFCFMFFFCAVSCTCSLWHRRPCGRRPVNHARITQSHGQHALTLANFHHESLGSLSVLRAVLFGMYPSATKGLMGNEELQKTSVSKNLLEKLVVYGFVFCFFCLWFSDSNATSCRQVHQWDLVKTEATSRLYVDVKQFLQMNILKGMLHMWMNSTSSCKDSKSDWTIQWRSNTGFQLEL